MATWTQYYRRDIHDEDSAKQIYEIVKADHGYAKTLIFIGEVIRAEQAAALADLVAAAHPVDSDAKANYQKAYGGLVYTCMIRAKDMDKFLAAVERARSVMIQHERLLGK